MKCFRWKFFSFVSLCVCFLSCFLKKISNCFCRDHFICMSEFEVLNSRFFLYPLGFWFFERFETSVACLLHEMATVFIADVDTAFHFARRTRIGDKYVLLRRCVTPKVVFEFLCLQESDTILLVNNVYRFKVNADWFFVKDGEDLLFNKVSLCFF